MDSGIHPDLLAPGVADPEFWLEALFEVQRVRAEFRKYGGDNDVEVMG